MNRKIQISAVSVALIIASYSVPAEDHQRISSSMKLPPDVLGLLQNEMKELASAVGRIAPAIAKADWAAIQKEGQAIHVSYVLAKSLTAEQRVALTQSLPKDFMEMDAKFHARALRLAAAAESKDYELASYHYTRLIDSCAECHSKYATHRFTGFSPKDERHEHGH